jgi:drug/metabolite transporter superfamily protein YnfA
MNILRAVSCGVLIWLLSEALLTILNNIPLIKDMENLQYIFLYIFIIPFVIFSAWIYYKNNDTLKSSYLGLFFLSIFVILELLITAPIFIRSYAAFFNNYLLNVKYLASLAEIVVITIIYDRFIKKTKYLS